MNTLPLTVVMTPSLQVPGMDPWYADPQDPAICVMTDFRERPSVIVSQTTMIDEALEHMKHSGVRSAFAVDDRSRAVVGLITAYDIVGQNRANPAGLTAAFDLACRLASAKYGTDS